MVCQTTVHIANEKLTAETRKTSGNFFETTSTSLNSTKGAYDLINSLKKAADLIGNDNILSKTKGYISVTAVPRVYTTAHTICKSYQAYQKDRVVTFQRVADFAHQLCDFSAMVSFTTAFCRRNPTTSLSAGAVLNAASDTTDAFSCVAQVVNGAKRRSQLTTAGPVIQRANDNALINSVLKLIKAVTAAVAGFFASFLIFTGTVFISPVIAVTVALTSTIFSILSYYHENYWCDSFLKVEYTPVKFA